MDEDTFLQYLADHPDSLLRHHDALLAAGVRFPAPGQQDENNPHNANIIDVTGKIANKARLEARKATETNQSLLNVAAENMLHWRDLHHATLGFLACQELAGFAQMVHEELPLIFGLASSNLVMPRESAISNAEALGFITLPQSDINAMIAEDLIYMGAVKQACLSVISAPSESLAIMRLPDQLPLPIAGSVLILGGRQKDSFTQGKGRSLLLHLSEMVGVCLLRLIESPSATKHQAW
ncbi:MAG: DUF484 family protein [Candidatus Puniceispirillaceae bacterium]